VGHAGTEEDHGYSGGQASHLEECASKSAECVEGIRKSTVSKPFANSNVLTKIKFDCHHFTKCNEWLEQRYGKDGGIDWDLNVDPEEAGV
jgi:uracil DNA glycosylase